MTDKAQIYIVEDSVPSALLYQSYLDTLGYQVRLFHSGLDAIAGLNDKAPDILLLDVQLPDISGLDILKEITGASLPTRTIVMSSATDLGYAVEATRHGAFDFIEKPFTKDRLLVTVTNALREFDLSHTLQAYSSAIETEGFGEFIGSSPAMKLVYQIINNVAPSTASVFITGESGTGKELCASAIHQTSKRSSGPFVPINCAAIPKNLFESEIFGHVKGAFSGAVKDRIGAAEQANGGTLFLDEMCEMDLNLQAKLLRLIQSGTFQKVGSEVEQSVDVRFVCATNRSPLVEVREGRFREDLYYRLNVVPIELPPLRQRDDDVLLIAEKLLQKFNKDMGKQFRGISDAAASLMLDYQWPGNVRELQNLIENIVIMNNGEEILPEMLPDAIRTTESRGVGSLWMERRKQNLGRHQGLPERRRRDSNASSEVPVAATASPAAVLPDSPDDIRPLWETEKAVIEHAIRLCGDNVPQAAARLGVSPSTLYRKMKSWENQA